VQGGGDRYEQGENAKLRIWNLEGEGNLESGIKNLRIEEAEAAKKAAMNCVGRAVSFRAFTIKLFFIQTPLKIRNPEFKNQGF